MHYTVICGVVVASESPANLADQLEEHAEQGR